MKGREGRGKGGRGKGKENLLQGVRGIDAPASFYVRMRSTDVRISLSKITRI